MDKTKLVSKNQPLSNDGNDDVQDGFFMIKYINGSCYEI